MVEGIEAKQFAAHSIIPDADKAKPGSSSVESLVTQLGVSPEGASQYVRALYTAFIRDEGDPTERVIGYLKFKIALKRGEHL